MLGEWCYFKSHFSKSECEQILELSKDYEEQESTIGTGTSNKIDTKYRRSKLKFIQESDPNFSSLFSRIWNLGIRANKDWFKFHLEKLDFMQLAQYDSKYQGEYKRHHDIFYMNDDPYYHRKLSCIVQLTDPTEYEGGDFVLYNTSQHPDKDEIRQQGTVIFFPSFIEHSAQPVTNGVRYSLASWIEGPKWK